MKEKYIKYQIESIVNKRLYEQQLIDYDKYKSVEDKLTKLLFEFKKSC